MKKNLLHWNTKYNLFFLFCFLGSYSVYGQADWPLNIEKSKKNITIFKPKVEMFNTSSLSFRTAFSYKESNEAPVFGSLWADAKITNNTSKRKVIIRSIMITDIRFPDGISDDLKEELSGIITSGFNSKQPEIFMDDILDDLDNLKLDNTFASQINNTPPKIIYTETPSLLVLIDGDPMLENTETAGVDIVVNTPFLILKYKNTYYLSNGKLWYKATTATGNYQPEKNPPVVVENTATSLEDSNDDAVADFESGFYPQIIVSTEPAELIQTEGSPKFSAIEGTALLYVVNTEEQLLLDIEKQNYYALLSGRWYTSKKLTTGWTYVPLSDLPADFARIPEGSDKDIVLASVPGTQAAYEAVHDAEVPHVAMVDRNTATTEVRYDGDPQFYAIEGTDMRLANNSSNTVIVEHDNYYVVDNGVWYVGRSANGPWRVSDHRPAQVNRIPPSSPAYTVRYVHIYHANPQVVYVGYTQGYLSGIVVGPTVVYGTGFRYHPWRGHYFYPRPATWGFGMAYNPWLGWSINVRFGVGGRGWLGFGHPHHFHPGWWGPPVFRPPYRPPFTHCYGHIPARPRPIRYGPRVASRPVQSSRPSSIYRGRNQAGVTPTRTRISNTRPTTREDYNYSRRAQPTSTRPSSNSRPTNQTTRSRGTTVTRQPNTRPNTGSTRPSNNSNLNTTRPSRGSNTGNDGRSSSTRPSSNSETRPNRGSSTSSGSNTRPSSGTRQTGTEANRPTRGTSTSGSSTRPSAGSDFSSGRPLENQPEKNSGSSTRPSRESSSSSSSRPSSGTQSGSSSTSSTRPSRESSSSSSSRPSSGTQSGSSSTSSTPPSRGSSSSSSNSQSGSKSSSSTRVSSGSGSSTRSSSSGSVQQSSGSSSSSTRQSSSSSSRSSGTRESSGRTR